MNLIKGNLSIRNAMASDAGQLATWWNDGSIMAHAGYPSGLNITTEEIRNSLATDRDDTHRRHIIEIDNKPIGEMNYRNKGNKVAEIGIKICDTPHREKGLGTTLLAMFMDALFMYYGYEKIILDTNVENKRAQHVYEKKLGFKFIRLNENAFCDQLGKRQSSIDYEITKKDWISAHNGGRSQIASGDHTTYIHIRQEQPTDHFAVESLTRDAFWPFRWDGLQICDEHLLVHKLRKCNAFIPELNLVAELDGKPVGHIIYTRSKIIDDADNAYSTLTFGPLSVHPNYQGRGIGQALMRHSFKIAKDLGHRAVIIFGHPNYYPRVGFRRAGEFGITTSDRKTFDPFMAYPLYDGALDGIKGRYYLAPIYETLTQEDALEFDKKFPPKAQHTTIPMDILLGRLKTPGKESIQALNFTSMAMLQTKSEAELLALEGIDSNTIKIIRTVMGENGLSW